MIALASFVVVPEYARTINHVGKPVLEAVGASRQRFRQLPEDQLSKRRRGVDDFCMDKHDGVHAGEGNKIQGCCQLVQHGKKGDMLLFCESGLRERGRGER